MKAAIFSRILGWTLIVLNISLTPIYAQQQVRVKDVAKVDGLEDLQLFGYGLVVGLAGTGDRNQTIFTTQTIMNMLKNMGIELPEKYMRVRNVAAVMITGTLSPFKKRGTRFDVTVSSMGDASSLEGGTLILTPLQGPDGNIYASAQGPLATGGYDVRDKGLTHIKKNHVLVGRIPDGAIVQQQYELITLDPKELSLSLLTPDFTSAMSMARAINQELDTLTKSPVARAIDAATVAIDYAVIQRDTLKHRLHIVEFISRIENTEFIIANQARVVVNERTGTIVAGADVRISEIAVTHGGVKVEIVNKPEAVQPMPFSIGQTTTIPNPDLVVEEKDAELVVLNGTSTVSDLAQALNSLGVAPRDVISIFQAIKQAGALHAELLIM
ncbi:MAG: flagellar basal body P-ring protein FlgI [Chitinivibrionales bacterium]|nr:flagellar basal body P-ring protein FlgI [Chitinivibrionales bacterium]